MTNTFRHRERRIARRFVFLVLAFFGGFFAQKYYGATVEHGPVVRETARVTKVVDGDTIILRDGRIVRYIGIDTPETGKGFAHTQECYADEATARNRELVGGRDVVLVRDVSETDRYGRILRYVYVGDTFVNEQLVREGFARARRYPPDTAKSAVFMEAQRSARSVRSGLWDACQN